MITRPLYRPPVSGIGTLLVAALVPWAPAPAHADDGVIRLRFGDSERVTGSGRLQTEHRAITGFRAIEVRGAMTLVVRQGPREGVDLRADDNLLPAIETRVVDRGGIATLEIGPRRGTSLQSRDPIVATVELTTLSALTVAGSAEVESDALKSPSLQLSISGSGNVRMRGLDAAELAKPGFRAAARSDSAGVPPNSRSRSRAVARSTAASSMPTM
jgi:hypothetical protein